MKRIVVAALWLLSGVTAQATTYKMMSDAHLADAAPAIAQVRVTAVEPSPAVGMPSTDYLVEVERLVKGFVPGSTLVVRVPGGIGTGGLGLKVWGAPAFRSGERALLFLAPHADDGTYRVVHMMLGAFHVVERSGRRFVLRDLSEATEVTAHSAASGAEAGSDRARELAGFVRWLEDRAAGRHRAADYLATTPNAIEGNFSFLLPEDGIAIRWFRFDTGLSVRWRVHQGAQGGIPLGLATSSLGVATGVWNDDSSSNINYGVDGTTSASNGLGRSDNTNTLLFNDPGNQVEGTFDCSTGGVIAAAGPFFFSSTREYRGVRYHEAVEADIVTNDGTDCFFSSNPKTVEEIFGHELGHTLGLGHSRERQALMFANAHADGRGASLSSDDRAGVAVLYGDGSTPPPPPPPPPPGLKAPTQLAAQILSSTRVKLTWKDNATIEEQYLVERKRIGGSWRQVLILPANATTATVTGLTPGKPFAFRVRVKKGTAFSPYSDTVRTPNLPTR